jgi:hypothetical protein
MAHFAKLDKNNIVVEVHKIANEVLDLQNEEESGIAFLTSWSNGYTNWKQTSYNNSIRGTYAGIGYTYNPDEDIFVTPQPYPSWSRSGSFWNPPSPKPEGLNWSWDEKTLSWIEIEA